MSNMNVTNLPPELLEQLLGHPNAPEILARLGASVLPASRGIIPKEHWPKSVDEWYENYHSVCKKMLAEEGKIEAVLCCLSIDDNGDLVETHLLISHMMKNNTTKQVLADSMVAVLEQVKAFAVLFISETWVASVSDDKEAYQHPEVMANNGSLEFYPGRKEALLLSLETKNSKKSFQYEILRNEQGWPSLAEETMNDPSTPTSGRFIGLLKEAPEQFH